MPAHKGSAHHLAVLTEEAVRQARREYRSNHKTAQQLAEEHHVTAGAMRRALNGITWRHLTDTEGPEADAA